MQNSLSQKGKAIQMTTRRNLLLGGGAALIGLGAATWAQVRGMGSIPEYAAEVAKLRAALPPAPEARDLIRFATLAANGHNTQPWRFRVGSNGIDILPDLARRTPVVDPDDHHLFASLGCAAENLSLAAGAAGKTGEISFDPAGEGVVRFTYGTGAGVSSDLSAAIPSRQSTRTDYDGTQVSADDLRLLARAAALPGVDLVLITERAKIELLRDMVLAGNSAHMADPAFIAELKTWLRFNPHRALDAGDGLFSACTGNPALPDWLGPTMLDIMFTAKAENAKYASQIASSAGIAVFVAATADPEHWVLAGRACQRFALQATALGLKHAFLNQPVEVPELRAGLAALVGLPGRRPDIVMRFGRSAAMPFSARRPVEAVML
jgi:hypothetical protein